NLTFRYGLGEKKVLDQFNLDIKAGEKLAILGRSGSGKSTLATLLRGDLLA
ncbi:ATP-binding cassette domain-containing protein, partial [Streptococcus canis]